MCVWMRRCVYLSVKNRDSVQREEGGGKQEVENEWVENSYLKFTKCTHRQTVKNYDFFPPQLKLDQVCQVDSMIKIIK